MAAEIGHFALILSLFIGMAQIVLPMVGASRNDLGLMRFGSSAAVTGFACVALAFGCLAYSFLTSDFSVQLVAANSQLAKPLALQVLRRVGES